MSVSVSVPWNLSLRGEEAELVTGDWMRGYGMVRAVRFPVGHDIKRAVQRV